MRTHRIAAIPADGIGKEVIPAGLRVLEALAGRVGDFRLDVTEFPWGSDYYRQTGKMMAEDGLETIEEWGVGEVGWGRIEKEGRDDWREPYHPTFWECGGGALSLLTLQEGLRRLDRQEGD